MPKALVTWGGWDGHQPDKVAAIVMLGNLAALGFVPLGLWLGM